MVTLGAALTGGTASAVLQLIPAQIGGSGFIELAVLFFVLAIVAAIFGARGVAGVSMSIAKWFVIIFIVLAVVSLIL